jgi:DNA (cytosine-5)-methyltransferase 1
MIEDTMQLRTREVDGATVGYHRAGFTDIVGVDIKPQPRYPFAFVQADALEYVAEHGHEFDAIHGSPRCLGYSMMTHNLPWHRDRDYPHLILPTLQALEGLGRPYVIENVYSARKGSRVLTKAGLEEHGLEAGWLCGAMFGLRLYRHRLFATNFLWLAPAHPRHTLNLHPRSERWVYGGEVKGLPGGAAGVDAKPRNGASKPGAGFGHTAGWQAAAEAMGIDWMTRDELTEAIPPVFTEHIGTALLAALTPYAGGK